MTKKILHSPFLTMTLLSYIFSLIILLFGLEYDAFPGGLVYLAMVSTSIIRFGIANNILFDFLHINIGKVDIILEILVSVGFSLLLDYGIGKFILKSKKIDKVPRENTPP